MDDFTGLLVWEDSAEERLTKARSDHPLGYALVMAALCWNEVHRRGWRTPVTLGAQARRLMTAWRIPAESADDPDQVASALEWTLEDPALLECDNQGHYRPAPGTISSVGSHHWLTHHRKAKASGVLIPLELIEKGDSERLGNPSDLDAAEASYRLAVDSDDPDAAALAALRLAELAEEREQPAEAARQYATVAALGHPVASPPAKLWLARQAALDDDRATARALTHQVVESNDESLLPMAWDLLASLDWRDEDRDGAVAAIRRAVDTAGAWHWSYSRRLAAMLIACGDVSGAADAYRKLLDQPLLEATDAGQYVQLMAAADRLDEAVTVLEQLAPEHGFFSGNILLALVSAYATRDDLDATRQALARVRSHWSAGMPQMSVQADVMEASLAAAEGDDELAARLFRSLTDTDDTERRDLARPLLIAAGDRFAAGHKLCLIPGVRPLLEYLCEAAGPETATWAATSLAHLATVEGRPDDAEAAVRLAARHMKPEEVTLLRMVLLQRAGREHDALAHLVDACTAATPSTLMALLVTMTAFGMRDIRLNEQQRLRLRAVVDSALFPDDQHGGDDERGGDNEHGGDGGDDEDDEDDEDDAAGVRERLALVMAQFEIYACFGYDRALELLDFAVESDEPTVAASAWLNLGLVRQLFAPIAAAQAFEQAILLGDAEIGARAATELARLADRLGDDTVAAQACERMLDLAEGDDWARAALRLGLINQYRHPDDAEVAYHAALAEPGAHPATIGTALARLGALYAMHGNRRLAQRIWQRGKRHRDPDVAQAFTTERTRIGRVHRFRRPRALHW